MNPRIPLFASIFLGGGLVLIFATSSWKSQPWGLATFIAAVVAVNMVGLALMLRMKRHQH